MTNGQKSGSSHGWVLWIISLPSSLMLTARLGIHTAVTVASTHQDQQH